MTDEFEKWPGHFQKPGEEEEDHTLHVYTYPGYILTRKEDRPLLLAGNVEKFWHGNKHRRNAR